MIAKNACQALLFSKGEILKKVCCEIFGIFFPIFHEYNCNTERANFQNIYLEN